MAMVTKHNLEALNTLNVLNQNDSELAKSLRKASTGMRINGAVDGASEFAIGSRMDVMIRSLNQDRVNSETGRNLIGVAEGAIQEIVNNIRSMKEMAINAANDTNTDEDRIIIEKEFRSRMYTISDIAAETNYNGRYLLNGMYSEPVNLDDYGITSNGLQLFPVDGSPLNPNYTEETWARGLQGYVTPQVAGTNNYGIPINFSGATVNGSPAGVSDFDGQGFVTVCNVGSGRMHGFASVVFTSDLPLNTGQVVPSALGGTNSSMPEYRIGIEGAATIRDIEDSLYNALMNLNGTRTPLLTSSTGAVCLTPDGHNMQVEVDADGNYTLVQDRWAMWIYNGVLHDQAGMSSEGNPLIIHTGPKQNQELYVFINSMSPIAMGLNAASVVTRAKASSAMGICDSALEYALNENTRMGAYMSRLDFTVDNLVTAHENTISSKSNILDADMAKVMSEFHKQNTLTQSAQFMLAQANQNTSSVLSLLQ